MAEQTAWQKTVLEAQVIMAEMSPGKWDVIWGENLVILQTNKPMTATTLFVDFSKFDEVTAIKNAQII